MLFFAPGARGVEDAAKPGWEKVSWGMTVSQVKAAYPGAVAFSDEAGPWLSKGKDWPRLELEGGHDFAGEPFRVFFLFDKTKELRAVHLEYRVARYTQEPAARCRAFLIEKYGDPVQMTKQSPNWLAWRHGGETDIVLRFQSDNRSVVPVSWVKVWFLATEEPEERSREGIN